MEQSYTLLGLAAEAEPIAPGLYLVATPIGNLRDITLRALSTLAAADRILAEDTRVTKTLLAHYGITTPMSAYHEHNAAQMQARVLEELKAGAKLALVSDAGTPLVSDPGSRLVEAVVATGAAITVVPGASAVLAGLVLSGLAADRFFFEGFLPSKSTERRRRIRALEAIPGALIFFEAPHRLQETLVDLSETLGMRKAAVARELTKRFETVIRADLPDLVAHYERHGQPKGEIVIIVDAPGESAGLGEDAIDAALLAAMVKLSQRDAVAVVAAELGLPRKIVYARALMLGSEKTTEKPR